uniref:Uncharacterized protein n=1 Tax=Theileria annulata TaxID=5874 RepID=A0A3B0N3X4_THEAN
MELNDIRYEYIKSKRKEIINLFNNNKNFNITQWDIHLFFIGTIFILIIKNIIINNLFLTLQHFIIILLLINLRYQRDIFTHYSTIFNIFINNIFFIINSNYSNKINNLNKNNLINNFNNNLNNREANFNGIISIIIFILINIHLIIWLILDKKLIGNFNCIYDNILEINLINIFEIFSLILGILFFFSILFFIIKLYSISYLIIIIILFSLLSRWKFLSIHSSNGGSSNGACTNRTNSNNTNSNNTYSKDTYGNNKYNNNTKVRNIYNGTYVNKYMIDKNNYFPIVQTLVTCLIIILLIILLLIILFTNNNFITRNTNFINFITQNTNNTNFINNFNLLKIKLFIIIILLIILLIIFILFLYYFFTRNNFLHEFLFSKIILILFNNYNIQFIFQNNEINDNLGKKLVNLENNVNLVNNLEKNVNLENLDMLKKEYYIELRIYYINIYNYVYRIENIYKKKKKLIYRNINFNKILKNLSNKSNKLLKKISNKSNEFLKKFSNKNFLQDDINIIINIDTNSTTIPPLGPSTVTEENSTTHFAAPGKGANFTAMECTMGKGANFTAMECTSGKGANDTFSTPGKGANSTAMECTMGKGANSMVMECTTEENSNTFAVVTNFGESDTFNEGYIISDVSSEGNEDGEEDEVVGGYGMGIGYGIGGVVGAPFGAVGGVVGASTVMGEEIELNRIYLYIQEKMLKKYNKKSLYCLLRSYYPLDLIKYQHQTTLLKYKLLQYIQQFYQFNLFINSVYSVTVSGTTENNEENSNTKIAAKGSTGIKDTEDITTIGASTVTEEKNSNEIAVVTKFGESGTNEGKGANFMHMECTMGSSGTVEASTVTEEELDIINTFTNNNLNVINFEKRKKKRNVKYLTNLFSRKFSSKFSHNSITVTGPTATGPMATEGTEVTTNTTEDPTGPSTVTEENTIAAVTTNRGLGTNSEETPYGAVTEETTVIVPVTVTEEEINGLQLNMKLFSLNNLNEINKLKRKLNIINYTNSYKKFIKFNKNINDSIGGITDTIGTTTVTTGKGANFTAMECTSGKGANFTAMECTEEKNLNTIAAVTNFRESSNNSINSEESSNNEEYGTYTDDTSIVGVPDTVTEEYVNNIMNELIKDLNL